MWAQADNKPAKLSADSVGDGEATMQEKEAKDKEIAKAKADVAKAEAPKPNPFSGNIKNKDGSWSHLDGSKVGGANHWVAKKHAKHHKHHYHAQ